MVMQPMQATGDRAQILATSSRGLAGGAGLVWRDKLIGSSARQKKIATTAKIAKVSGPIAGKRNCPPVTQLRSTMR